MGPVTNNPFLIAIINMVVVFGVLIVLGVLMHLIEMVDPTKKKAAPKAAAPVAAAPAAVAAAPVVEDKSEEIAAVIAAAVAACGGSENVGGHGGARGAHPCAQGARRPAPPPRRSGRGRSGQALPRLRRAPSDEQQPRPHDGGKAAGDV